MEKMVKDKLGNNWNSVRKAFLELDTNYDGELTAEELFKVFGPQNGHLEESNSKRSKS